MRRVAETEMLIMIAGKTLKDRVRNEHTRPICGVYDVARWD